MKNFGLSYPCCSFGGFSYTYNDELKKIKIKKQHKCRYIASLDPDHMDIFFILHLYISM